MSSMRDASRVWICQYWDGPNLKMVGAAVSCCAQQSAYFEGYEYAALSKFVCSGSQLS